MDVPESAGAQQPVNRLERRKMRTRAALIRAAQQFIAEGKLAVPILEITQAADVGMGSFYNHFDSKEQLFEVALTDALDHMGAVLDVFTETIADPAEAFVTRFRLSGRLFRHRPQEAALLLSNAGSLIFSDHGLSPRAHRDIAAAIDAGRFALADPDVGLALAGGALIGLATLLREHPERDADDTVDVVAQSLLRSFGITAKQAAALCALPLPDIASLADTQADGPSLMTSRN
ncbi:TetR/AcrR family transcriptional regulator [Mycolicibacterium sp. 018/SC-01/001]|uniref:TetR/AcrR family transcriptional regulator n=1 Tax=Mycolicibacterium sp. 018/SC-01/001 TaxID=2592069 RepID=UPI0011802206|nr:TetR/AcrR family transcriptional regulator [Mycolicibacterium sp. 018/SC-01/001]TRW89089.1 TetR/AcrR family transcriptional regulator [Mycolicibacterium sp. 018/SC-01/001]